MNAGGELVDVRTLTAKIEDANLGVGHTTVETRLRVGLQRRKSAHIPPRKDGCQRFRISAPSQAIVCAGVPGQRWEGRRERRWTAGGQADSTDLVLAVAVASRGTTGHFDGLSRDMLWC